MKVTLVYFDFMGGAEGKYYEGFASISAVLKNNGHIPSLFHVINSNLANNFIDIFDKQYSDSRVVGFSANTNTIPYVKKFSLEIKKRYKNIITICGGIHPTICPGESVESEGIDIICIGEGEFPMLELCNRLEANQDISNIQNLWIKKSGTIIKNSPRLLMNLDVLPIPDRTIFNYEISTDCKWNRLVFIASRGCPFLCAHCSNDILKKILATNSQYTRFKSPAKFIEEIKFYIKKYNNINHINFQDDILTLQKSWFKEFSYLYKKEINLPYICNSRVELIDKEVIDILKDTGCLELRFGLESGDDFIRKKILNRNQEEEAIIDAANLCHEKGIKVYVYTMVGIPFENLRRVMNTAKLAAKIKATSIQVSIYYPYPKTRLYELCKEKGFLTNKHLDSYYERDSTLKLPGFSKKEIVFAYDNLLNLTQKYNFISRFSKPYNIILEKIIDFLWLTRHFYFILKIPTFLYLKFFSVKTTVRVKTPRKRGQVPTQKGEIT